MATTKSQEASLQVGLLKVQEGLRAPKNQKNAFANYNYRSAEDILEALKPHLVKNKLCMTISDSVLEIGGRVYVKATIRISHSSDPSTEISVDAFAREEMSRKGMDSAQITGTASSYARKYALNGLFLIDDQRDADATNDHKGKTEEDEILELETILGEKEDDILSLNEYLVGLGALSDAKYSDIKDISSLCTKKIREKIIKNPNGFWKAFTEYKNKKDKNNEL